MKFSFNLAKRFSNDDFSGLLALSPAGFGERLNGQIGAYDGIEWLKEKYKGVTIAKIVSAVKHPNADRLKICLINDGGVVQDVERNKDGLVQVVCGAPNAKAELTVAWIPPGSVVPTTYQDDEPFVLSRVELRGEVSNGMLASPKELGISDEHDGILGLESELQAGSKFIDVMGLDDVVVDFENKMFTKRPDCFGHLGIARELSGIESKIFKSPSWYTNLNPEWPEVDSGMEINVVNEVQDLCVRYMAIVIEGLDAGKSPLWMQATLSSVGVRPVNKLVDITNFVMMVTGQPLHAFDYGKVGDSIAVRLAKAGEELELLGGKKIKLDPADIVVTDGSVPIALGGVMGGANSEVDKDTKSIILEVANFNMYSVRRTSMRHGLFTDGVTRFTKNQSPEQIAPVMNMALQMIEELYPEARFSAVVDDGGQKFKKRITNEVRVELGKINNLLGLRLSVEEVVRILKTVELVARVQGESLVIEVPFWRKDLEIAEDIVEEVGRLYGLSKIKAVLPVKPINPPRENKKIILKKRLRETLKELGCSELTNYSFVSAKLINMANQDPNMAFALRNALSPELEHYRMSLIPSLLDKVNPNIRDGYDEVALYEVGKVHIKDHLAKDPQTEVELPDEFDRLGAVFASKQRSIADNGAPFYLAKRYATKVLDSLKVPYQFVTLDEEFMSSKVPILSVYAKGRAAGIEVAGELRGVVGEFNYDVVKDFKLPEYSAGFELDLEILARESKSDFNYKPLSEFPRMYKDLTVTAHEGEVYSDVLERVESLIRDGATKLGIEFDISPISIYKAPESENIAYTFGFEIWHNKRTLKTKEANKILSNLL